MESEGVPVVLHTPVLHPKRGFDAPGRVPIGQVKLLSGKILDGRGVFPEVPVDALLDPAGEPWPEGIREGLDRAQNRNRAKPEIPSTRRPSSAARPDEMVRGW